MAETMTIDLKTLLVEKADCDAGTGSKLKEGLAQGGNQFRSLRHFAHILQKKPDAAGGTHAEKSPPKLRLRAFFLGSNRQAVEDLPHPEAGLAAFCLGLALNSRYEYGEGLKAFERAEHLK